MSPVVKGLLFALAAKAAQTYMHQRQGSPGGSPTDAPGAEAPPGGLGGLLGDLIGSSGGGLGGLVGGGSAGGGLGGLMGALGGAGGLGALVSQLTAGGHGQEVNSWVSQDANKPIPPQALGAALGEEHVAELEQHTGLPRDQLLSQLATELPSAVDAISPEGRLPSDSEVRQSMGG